MSTLTLSINPRIYNKQAPTQADYVNFQTVTWAPPQLTSHITSGKAICVAALRDNYRKKDYFVSSQLIGIDFDAGMDLDDLVKDEFIRQYAYLLYRTPSYTPEAPHVRALCILDTPVKDAARYRVYMRRILQKYPAADDSAKDEVRIFYGSDRKDHRVVHERRLPVAVLEALPIHPSELQRAEPIEPPPAYAARIGNNQLDAYVQRAVQDELDALAITGNQRHNALNETAFNLGQLVGASWAGLHQADMETALFNAANHNGYVAKVGESEVRRVIGDGLRDGQREPRPQPPMLAPIVRTPATQDTPIEILRERIVGQVEMIGRYREQVNGAVHDEGEPLMMPFKVLYSFGGFARVMTPGKMIAVAAASGGGKTMFQESFVDEWRKAGVNCLTFSPEWDADEQAARLAQRYGAPTLEQISLHKVWKAYNARGASENLGVPLTKEQEAAALKAADEVEQWRGKWTIIKGARYTLNELLTVIEDTAKRKRDAGEPIRVLTIDYAQMLKINARDEKARTLNDAISLIKDVCIEQQLVGLVASQVTKQDGRLAASNEKALDENSAQFLRFDEFNLAMTLQLLYVDNQFTNTGKINIVKNNTGRKGEITVYVNTERGAWIDHQAMTQKEAKEAKKVDFNDI